MSKLYLTRNPKVAARSLDGEMMIMSGKDSTLFTLNKTATGINTITGYAQQRQELIARNAAEMLVAGIFKSILELVCKHQQEPRIIRLRNQWVPMDPREWQDQMDVTVTVGLPAPPIINRIVPLADYERARIEREVHRHRRFIPIMVREFLTWEEMAAIEVNAPDLPGVLVDVGTSRVYPYSEQLAHVVGYVAPRRGT